VQKFKNIRKNDEKQETAPPPNFNIEWSHWDLATLYSIINSTKEKYFSVAFIWMVAQA